MRFEQFWILPDSHSCSPDRRPWVRDAQLEQVGRDLEGDDGDGGVDAGGEHIDEPLSQPVCSSRCERSGQSGSL